MEKNEQVALSVVNEPTEVLPLPAGSDEVKRLIASLQQMVYTNSTSLPVGPPPPESTPPPPVEEKGAIPDWEINEQVDRMVFGYDVPARCATADYASDMHDAWKVVEELRRRGFWVSISTADACGWEVEIVTSAPLYEQGYRGVWLEDTEPARAICRAAIRSMTKYDET